ncbi:MAG TPA: transglutaminase family protein [Trebonia sp.]|jgi:transglutaminase-like putative cysteine protease|nr:transglutaminase family protein [Trebonia sp.]
MGGHPGRAGWRLRIAHVTEITYAGPVLASFNEARMTPLTLPTQTTFEARLTAGPGPVATRTYADYWGTSVTAFELPDPHDHLVVEARATVATSGPIPAVRGLPWDTLRAAAAGGRLLKFCLPTSLTTMTPGSVEAAIADIAGLPPRDAAAAVAARVHDKIAFVPGATSVRGGAQEAWDKGQGVCQDMAHVTVALLRAAGLPARYVSGYLHPDPEARPGRVAVGQSHAWAEYWAGSWSALDPTSLSPVGERHVVVARGRDYDDVPPLRGVYQGPAETALNVFVQLIRLA